MTPSLLVNGYGRFGRPSCLHLKDLAVPPGVTSQNFALHLIYACSVTHDFRVGNNADVSAIGYCLSVGRIIGSDMTASCKKTSHTLNVCGTQHFRSWPSPDGAGRHISHCLYSLTLFSGSECRYAPHNDVSVNDGPHIRRWSHNIILLYIIIRYYNTIVLQLPTIFSTVTCCTGF